MKDELPQNEIFEGNCCDILPQIPDESVQLTVTSTPYNIGKNYGDYDDSKPIDQWKMMMETVMEELFRITKPDGKVCINVGFSTGKTDEEGRFYRIPLNKYIIDMALDVGFDMFDEYLWIKNSFASHGGGALFGSYPYPTNFMANQQHEYILVFRKWVSDDYYSKREIPKKSVKEESKLSKEEWKEYTRSIWEIEPVKPKSLGVDHTAMFPVEVPKRLIKLYSFVGDTVIDPFIGTGTTALAAKNNDRKYIGIEQNSDFIDVIDKRLKGSLKRTARSRKRAKKAQQKANNSNQQQTDLNSY